MGKINSQIHTNVLYASLKKSQLSTPASRQSSDLLPSLHAGVLAKPQRDDLPQTGYIEEKTLPYAAYALPV